MAKNSGSTKRVAPNTMSKDESRDAFSSALGSGNYDISRSYFSEEGNGSVLFHKGHNIVDSEIEAAKIMADNGYDVQLTPENDRRYVKIVKGKDKYVEGTVSAIEFEQATPNPTNRTVEGRTRSVNKALEHAMGKEADIALIYDKYNSFHREDIDRGIKRFEKLNKHRFKAILTVNTRREVHEWWHN